MSFGKTPCFTTTLWAGILAVIASFALSAGLTGCRLGNKVEKAEPPYSPSGYYQTELQEVTLTATVEGVKNTVTDLDKIPKAYNNLMTNPVYLIFSPLQETETEAAKEGFKGHLTIENGSGDYRLSDLLLAPSPYPPIVGVDETDKEGITLWDDPNCKWIYKRVVQGDYSKFEDTIRSADGQLLKGGLSLRIDVQHSFVGLNPGDCTLSLQALSSCYQDVTKCGQETDEDNKSWQSDARFIVDPFIQAGALDLIDIERAESLKFTILYK